MVVEGEAGTPEIDARIARALAEATGNQARCDLVISDMAPNISGNRSVDQPRAMYLAELAFDADNKITAYRVQSKCNLGAYNSQFAQFIQTQLFSRVLMGVYDVQTTWLRVEGIYTNTTYVDAYRGAGRPEATDHALRALAIGAFAVGAHAAGGGATREGDGNRHHSAAGHPVRSGAEYLPSSARSLYRCGSPRRSGT